MTPQCCTWLRLSDAISKKGLQNKRQRPEEYIYTLQIQVQASPAGGQFRCALTCIRVRGQCGLQGFLAACVCLVLYDCPGALPLGSTHLERSRGLPQALPILILGVCHIVPKVGLILLREIGCVDFPLQEPPRQLEALPQKPNWHFLVLTEPFQLSGCQRHTLSWRNHLLFVSLEDQSMEQSPSWLQVIC